MRLKDKTANLLLTGASTLLMLLVFEAGFRVRAHLENRGILDGTLDPGIEPPKDGPANLGHMIRLTRNRRMVYELKPNLSVEYQGALVTLDGQGFRGAGSPVEAEGGGFRIVGIGDSFMFGQGVEDDEPYLAVLEAELNRRQPARRWQVINTAVPGYNTVMEVETLKQKGLRYRPDLVIVDFVTNDLTLPNFIRQKEPVLSLERSFLVDFFKQRHPKNVRKSMWRRLEMHGIVPGPKEAGSVEFIEDPGQVPPEYRDLVGWDSYRAAMTGLERLREEHGFAVLLIALKSKEDLLKDRALALSLDLGFEVLDVGAIFRRYVKRQGYASYLESPLALGPTDGHLSAAGHRLAAEAILEVLVGEGGLLNGAAARSPDKRVGR